MAARSASIWLESTASDWAWPSLTPAAEAAAPAAWVPSLPRPRLTHAPAARAAARPRPRSLPRPLRLARLALLVALAAATFELSSGLARSGVRAEPGAGVALRLDRAFSSPFSIAAPGTAALRTAPAVATPALPRPQPLFSDRAGSTIAAISYHSAALGWRDRFLVYLPPGFSASATRRYPVLYLLHGDEQPASSFLRLGLQPTLDRLIDSHAIRPLIAVMLSGAGAPQNWLNTSGPRYYSYIGEVQRLTDRVLPTIPDRAARAIAGYSMGGFGAMNVALTQLSNYSVVESWEGQFANLGSELAADRPLLARLPLHAFVWGGEQDTVVGYAADAPWAAAMRAAGAQATSAVYPGAHAFAPIAAHLAAMLSFAGRALRS